MSTISKQEKKVLVECYQLCRKRSEQFFKQGHRIKGNFFRNEAAVLCKFLRVDPKEGPTYTALLQELKKVVFSETTIKDVDIALKEVKNLLTKLRVMCAKLSSNEDIMKVFNDKISRRLQRVIVKLFEFCRKELDKQRQSRDQVQLPWRYAVIAFGSTARLEATPNSDFEWGILVDDDGSLDSDCRNYFRELTSLFHFLVICLGETILPAMAIEELEAEHFFDETTVRGFAFDGLMPDACKWPLGNLHHHNWEPTAAEAFELIGRPVDLAKFQSVEQYKKRPKFAFSLLNARFICGDQSLFDEYCQECTQMIRSKQDSFRSIVISLLLKDCKKYRFRTYNMTKGGALRSSKDLYRFFSLSIFALWFYERLSYPPYQQALLVVSLPTVELLEKILCFGEKGKANILTAFQLSLWLRLQAHHAQRGRDIRPATTVEFVMQCLRTAIPFGKKLQKLNSSSPSLDLLRSDEYVFPNTDMLNAIIMLRLGQFEQCKAMLKKVKKNLQDDDETERLRKWYLAYAEMGLGNRSKALELFDKLLKDETDPDMKTIFKEGRLNVLNKVPA